MEKGRAHNKYVKARIAVTKKQKREILGKKERKTDSKDSHNLLRNFYNKKRSRRRHYREYMKDIELNQDM